MQLFMHLCNRKGSIKGQSAPDPDHTRQMSGPSHKGTLQMLYIGVNDSEILLVALINGNMQASG